MKVGSLGVELVEELADGAEVQVTPWTLPGRAGLRLEWLGEQMTGPWKFMTETAGGKCWVGWAGTSSDCSISLMPA